MPWSEHHEVNGKPFTFMTMEFPPGLLIDVETLQRLTPRDLDELKAWVRRYADERVAVYRARDYEYRTEYLSRDDYAAVLAAGTATDQDRATARAALGALDRGEPYPPEPPPPPKRSTAGYVYLLSADNGLHKIGKSIRPDERVAHLAVKLPVRVELVHTFPSSDYTWAEATLHERYAAQRDHGEWFRLTSTDVVAICAIERLDP